MQIQALQPDRGQRAAPPRSKGAARSGSCRVTELGLSGDLSGYLKQRYVTEQRGLVGIARELRTSVSAVQALLEETGVPRRRPGWPPPPRRNHRGLMHARLGGDLRDAGRAEATEHVQMDTTRSTECTEPPLASAGLPLVGPHWPVPGAQRRGRGRVRACRPH